MNGRPLLERVAAALDAAKLEAVLIGNAAAALRGAPVTTLDFDFMFRKSAVSLRKLKAFARELDAIVLRPFYPVSTLYRVVADEIGLQVDFMSHVDGVRSFEGLRARAARVTFGGGSLLVASLADVVRSKRTVGRPKDLAVLEILERTLGEAQKKDKSR